MSGWTGVLGRAFPVTSELVCAMRKNLTTRIINGLATGGSYFSRQPLTREEKVLAAAVKVHRAVQNNTSVLLLGNQLEELCAEEAEAGEHSEGGDGPTEGASSWVLRARARADARSRPGGFIAGNNT